MTISQESWIELAPDTWSRGRLKDLIATAINGVWGNEVPDGESGTSCVRAADFDRVRQRVVTDSLPKRSITPQDFRRHQLRRGDIVLEKSGGGDRQPVGAAVLFDLPGPAVCTNFCSRVVPAAEVDSRFLVYVFAAAYSRGLTQGAIKQTTGIQNLDTYALFSSPWAYPPLDEQRRIADFLDAETSRINGIVQTQSRLTERLSERRAAGIELLVSGYREGNRKSSNLEWLSTVPSQWGVVRINLVAKMGSGHTPDRSRSDWWVNCDIPWITTGEVSQIRDDRQEVIEYTREYISRAGLANSAAELHPKNTVVLSRTASAGYSAVMGSEMATSQDYATWTCGPRLDPFYLLWCLRAMRNDLMYRLATGSTHKTIYFPDLQSIRIPLPPLSEQGRIVEEIRRGNSAVDELTDSISRQLDLLAERRQALITAAVTGQLDVTTARSGVRA